MVRTRYLFLKRLYSSDILIFKKNNKYLIYEDDYKIYNFLKEDNKTMIDIFDKYHINYKIIDNLTIVKDVTYLDNKYLEYFNKYKLFYLIKENCLFFLSYMI